MPHTFDTPPELWIGKGMPTRYPYDRVTALYHIKVLTDWVYRTEPRGDGKGFCMQGDE